MSSCDNRLRAARLCAAALIMSALATNALAQDPAPPRIETNEAYVETITRPTTLAIDDAMAVFRLVLDSLPDRVKVYPTENYYYFRFTHNGVRYAGDIRLAAENRDQGKVYFGYYEELAGWKQSEGKVNVGEILDETKGVKVERIEPLAYRLTYKEKSVVFALNDLTKVEPPASALGADERLVGPLFDESGIRFFLTYNTKLKIFHYVLDETVPVADQFAPAARSDRILIGKRTGFAFYRDHKLDRKILIGVHEFNVQANNYLDGPFDQIPENFIEGNTLLDMIVDSDPSVKGQIDRLWHYRDGSGRYVVQPYLVYREEGGLMAVHRCATSKKVATRLYHACFAFAPEQIEAPDPRPLALTRKWK